MDLNLKELNKEWENGFYESDWEPDTLEYTETERNILEELTTFLPRHMAVYDWNLPYADEIILIFRRHLKGITNQSSQQQAAADFHVNHLERRDYVYGQRTGRNSRLL